MCAPAYGLACPVCFHALEVGVSSDDLHTMWEATLLLRGDYRNGQDGLAMPDHRFATTIEKLLTVLSPTVH